MFDPNDYVSVLITGNSKFSFNRICPTKIVIGTNSALSAVSARTPWWINPLPPKMTTSTAPIVTIKTSPLAAMDAGSLSEEVINA